jgi:TldD protein
VDPQTVLRRAQEMGASFAEVRRETVDETRLRIEDGEMRGLISGSESGFALRVLVDGAWGFSASNELGPAAWKKALEQAMQLARAGKDAHHRVQLADIPAVRARVHWRPKVDPQNVSLEEKRDLLTNMEQAVRAHKEISNVTTAYSDSRIEKTYHSTDGAEIVWSMVRSVAQIHFTARANGQLAGRHTRVGGTKGFELFRDEDPVAKAAAAAAATVKALGAPAAKGGRRTVVIDSELAGVFAHEAVGHAAESDLIAAGESCFKGKIGQRIGIEGLTIRDDSTLAGAFGSFPYDDNGVVGTDKLLVQDGILRDNLCDREHAGALGLRANGAARAQDYAHRPLVRMSNTLIEAGDFPEDEIFAGIKDGVFCKGSRGGQVDTARGTYLFNAQEAYRIENGQITTPLRDVSLTGDILQTLHQIDALGNRQRLGDPGYCGKGQWVPVCDGGPLVRIQDCLVGGA